MCPYVIISYLVVVNKCLSEAPKADNSVVDIVVVVVVILVVVVVVVVVVALLLLIISYLVVGNKC